MVPCTLKIVKIMLRRIYKITSIVILVAFIVTSVKSPAYAQLSQDQMPRLPMPGVMVHLSPEFTPAYLQGITIHPDNALQFDFLIHKGDQELDSDQKKLEYTKLVKYFLASLTIPDEDQWVNLSPYEHNRIIKDDFGKTEMGRDLLAQDYMLKQITSSLIYPEDGLGKKFWARIYERAWKEYHTTSIPVNTFNKVWIVPDQAIVYESGNTAYILQSHLKVMLEEDYLSLQKHSAINNVIPAKAGIHNKNNTHAIASQVIREIILPELEKEVNEGKNFASLRQMYSGMVLATWYKKALKESLLGKVYADKAKVKGVDQDPKTNEAIYERYLKAFKKGVFNYIKEDVDKYTNEAIPRKYFSGGFRRSLVRMGPNGIPYLVPNVAVVHDFVTLPAEVVDQIPDEFAEGKDEVVKTDIHGTGEKENLNSGDEAMNGDQRPPLWNTPEVFRMYNEFRQDFRPATSMVVGNTLAQYFGHTTSPILEIGSGEGELSRLAQGMRGRIIQSDVIEDNLKRNQYDTPKIVVNVNAMQFPNNSIPGIVSYAVLDTFFDLDHATAEMHRVLREDGLMVGFIDLAPSADVVMASQDAVFFPAVSFMPGTNQKVMRSYLKVNRRALAMSFATSRHKMHDADVKLLSDYLKDPLKYFVEIQNSPAQLQEQYEGLFADILRILKVRSVKVDAVDMFKTALDASLQKAGFQLIESEIKGATLEVNRMQVRNIPSNANVMIFNTGNRVFYHDPSIPSGKVKVESNVLVVVARKISAPGQTQVTISSETGLSDKVSKIEDAATRINAVPGFDRGTVLAIARSLEYPELRSQLWQTAYADEKFRGILQDALPGIEIRPDEQNYPKDAQEIAEFLIQVALVMPDNAMTIENKKAREEMRLLPEGTVLINPKSGERWIIKDQFLTKIVTGHEAAVSYPLAPVSDERLYGSPSYHWHPGAKAIEEFKRLKVLARPRGVAVVLYDGIAKVDREITQEGEYAYKLTEYRAGTFSIVDQQQGVVKFFGLSSLIAPLARQYESEEKSLKAVGVDARGAVVYIKGVKKIYTEKVNKNNQVVIRTSTHKITISNDGVEINTVLDEPLPENNFEELTAEEFKAKINAARDRLEAEVEEIINRPVEQRTFQNTVAAFDIARAELFNALDWQIIPFVTPDTELHNTAEAIRLATNQLLMGYIYLGTVTREDIGADWDEVSKKLVENGWAWRISPTKIRITVNLNDKNLVAKMTAAIGDDFESRILPVLRKSRTRSEIYDAIAEYQAKGEKLDETDQYLLDWTLDDFRDLGIGLSGLKLTDEQQARVLEIRGEIGGLISQFQANLGGYKMNIQVSESDLEGIFKGDELKSFYDPQTEGYVINKFSSPIQYDRFMQLSTNAALRKQVEFAYNNRAAGEEVVTKDQFEKDKTNGLSWDEDSQILIDNGWARRKSPTEIVLTLKLRQDSERMSAIFGDKFSRILPILQQSLNNVSLLEEVLGRREELAKILGYDTYADYIIKRYMSNDRQEVESFLNQLKTGLMPLVAEEEAQLLDIKKETDRSATKIENWERAYYQNLLRERILGFDPSKLSELFPIDRTINNILDIYQEILDVTFTEVPRGSTNAWHKDARLFSVSDTTTGNFIGQFYLDIKAHDGKQGGFAVFNMRRAYEHPDGTYEPTVEGMVANFSGNNFTYKEVAIFMHEFGHLMHAALTRAKYPSLSGIHGVKRGADEVPSQMFENMVYHPEILRRIIGKNGRIQGKKVSDDLLNKMIASSKVGQAYTWLERVALSLVDLRYHTGVPGSSTEVYFNTMNEAGIYPTAGTHYQAAWRHIMGSNYDARFSTYAESLGVAEDDGERFIKAMRIVGEGDDRTVDFDPQVGREFRTLILEPGGSNHEAENQEEFLGHPPSDKPLLRFLGLGDQSMTTVIDPKVRVEDQLKACEELIRAGERDDANAELSLAYSNLVALHQQMGLTVDLGNLFDEYFRLKYAVVYYQRNDLNAVKEAIEAMESLADFDRTSFIDQLPPLAKLIGNKIIEALIANHVLIELPSGKLCMVFAKMNLLERRTKVLGVETRSILEKVYGSKSGTVETYLKFKKEYEKGSVRPSGDRGRFETTYEENGPVIQRYMKNGTKALDSENFEQAKIEFEKAKALLETLDVKSLRPFFLYQYVDDVRGFNRRILGFALVSPIPVPGSDFERSRVVLRSEKMVKSALLKETDDAVRNQEYWYWAQPKAIRELSFVGDYQVAISAFFKKLLGELGGSYSVEDLPIIVDLICGYLRTVGVNKLLNGGETRFPIGIYLNSRGEAVNVRDEVRGLPMVTSRRAEVVMQMVDHILRQSDELHSLLFQDRTIFPKLIEIFRVIMNRALDVQSTEIAVESLIYLSQRSATTTEDQTGRFMSGVASIIDYASPYELTKIAESFEKRPRSSVIPQHKELILRMINELREAREGVVVGRLRRTYYTQISGREGPIDPRRITVQRLADILNGRKNGIGEVSQIVSAMPLADLDNIITSRDRGEIEIAASTINDTIALNAVLEGAASLKWKQWRAEDFPIEVNPIKAGASLSNSCIVVEKILQRHPDEKVVLVWPISNYAEIRVPVTYEDVYKPGTELNVHVEVLYERALNQWAGTFAGRRYFEENPRRRSAFVARDLFADVAMTTTGEKVVVVAEDEIFIQMDITDALRRMGYVVLEAHNPKQLAKIMEEHGEEVDALVTDVRGWIPTIKEALDKVEQDHGKKIPVFATSGDSSAADLRAAGIPIEDGHFFAKGRFNLSSEVGKAVKKVLDTAMITTRSMEDLKTFFTGKNILIIDDEEPITKSLGMWGKVLGLNVTIANNGEEALKLLEDPDKKFDGMISDINMPVMDGEELARRISISTDPRVSNMPRVFWSGNHGEYSKPGEHLPFKNMPKIMRLLPKPMSTPELLSNLADVMDNSMTVRQLASSLSLLVAAALPAFGSGVNVVSRPTHMDTFTFSGMAPAVSSEDLGGINFNSSNLNLIIRRDGRGVPLPMALQDMTRLNNIQGFIPEIIEIRPAVNLPILSELQHKLQASST